MRRLPRGAQPRRGALQAGWFAFVDFKKLRLTLPAGNEVDGLPKPGTLIGNFADDKCPINVTFSVHRHGASNGSALNGCVLLVYRPDDEGANSATVCHETGHAMGMTVTPNKSKVPLGMVADNGVNSGGVYYTNKAQNPAAFYKNTHNGSHCATGCNGNDPTAGRGSCILYGSGQQGLDDRVSFCNTCRDFIRGRKLVDIRGSWSGRGNDEY